MDAKLQEIYNKYYDAKCYAILEKNFNELYPPEIWTAFKKQIDKGYVNIVNKNCWSDDFIYGGSNKIYLTKLITNAPQHNILLQYFNPYGNIQLADAISLLHECDLRQFDRIEIMDLLEFVLFVSSIMTHTRFCKSSRHKLVDYTTEIVINASFILRLIITSLVGNTDVKNTEIVLNIPEYYRMYTRYSALTFFFKDNKSIANAYNLKTWYATLTTETYKILCVDILTLNNFNLKMQQKYVKPTLVFEEGTVTPFERYMIDSGKLEETPLKSVLKIESVGIQKATDIVLKNCTDEEREDLKLLMSNCSEEYYATSDKWLEWVHNKLRMVKGENNLHMIKLPLLSQKFKHQEITQPLATVEIDMNKLAFDNATKDDNWLLATVTSMYVNAQDVNAIRASFQSRGDDMPLHVIIYNERKELNNRLSGMLTKASALLKSNKLHEYTYEITEKKYGPKSE